MKSLKEVEKMLFSELYINLGNIRSSPSLDYYNVLLGDTSFLLAGFLEIHLSDNFPGWEPVKWIDDSLITDAHLDKNKLILKGIMIWGRVDVTEQWVDPFYFEFLLDEDCKNFIEYNLYFGGSGHEITYEEYSQNRSFWENRNGESKRNWKYIVKCPPLNLGR